MISRSSEEDLQLPATRSEDGLAAAGVAALELSAITVRFGGILALSDVSFGVGAGESVGESVNIAIDAANTHVYVDDIRVAGVAP